MKTFSSIRDATILREANANIIFIVDQDATVKNFLSSKGFKLAEHSLGNEKKSPFASIFALRGLVRDIRPDGIFCYEESLILVLATAFRGNIQFPVFYYASAKGHANREWWLLEKFFLSRIDLIFIPIKQYIPRLARRYDLPFRKFEELGSGFSVETVQDIKNQTDKIKLGALFLNNVHKITSLSMLAKAIDNINSLGEFNLEVTIFALKNEVESLAAFSSFHAQKNFVVKEIEPNWQRLPFDNLPFHQFDVWVSLNHRDFYAPDLVLSIGKGPLSLFTRDAWSMDFLGKFPHLGQCYNPDNPLDLRVKLKSICQMVRNRDENYENERQKLRFWSTERQYKDRFLAAVTRTLAKRQRFFFTRASVS